MTISYVSTGTVVEADNAAVNPAYGSTSLANDVALIIGAMQTGSTGRSLAISGTYSQLDARGVSGQQPLYLWAKVAGAGETAPTVTPSGGAAGNVVQSYGILLRGAMTDMNNIVHNVAHTASLGVDNDTPIDTPALTITQDNCMLFLYLSCQGTISSLDDYDPGPGVWTPQVYAATATGNNQTVALYSCLQTTAANIPVSSITANGGASGTARAVLVALQPGTLQSMAAFPWLRA